MSLILKSTVTEGNGGKSLYFSDLTNIYDVSLNPGGWGAPNLTIGAVTQTHIKVTLPDSVTIIDILNPVGIPTTNITLKYEITAAILGSTTTYIPDGLYTIEYTVTDGITLYTTGVKYYLFTCNLECCISKLWLKVADDCICSCDNSTNINNALYAESILFGTKAYAAEGNTTEVANLISKLNQICNYSNSDCGCN